MALKKLPDKGMTRDEIVAAISESRKADVDWRGARTWSLVYFAGDDVLDVAKTAYTTFFSENGLNPMAFQSLKKFENEAVAMAADMLGGGPDAAGTLTSGGTESILLAVKAARDWARKSKPEVKEPEMALPFTAHPAFEKAAHYFDLKAVHIPVGADFRADVAEARKAVTRNTILMAGSAPCYPYGVVDPIPELAAIAAENKILFHTDACIGGFMLPFMKKLGHQIPPFDLSVSGVTSISADIHKYGYGAKGASLVIYKDAALRKHQFFVYTDWPGGVYPSPSMTGTRPGGAIAAAWAVMNFLGEEGYQRIAKQTMEAAAELIDGINAIPGMKVMGKPDMSVFAFTSEKVNVYELGDLMETRGWVLDRLQMPPALHAIVTLNHRKVVQPFLQDLRQCHAQLEFRPKTDPSGMAAVYGMVGTLPDRKAAKNLVIDFLDDLFKNK